MGRTISLLYLVAERRYDVFTSIQHIALDADLPTKEKC